ncbi:uncharacterized protein LOC114076920 [Solanum pennellii]|uniref:Uncharacterized protein LOC114076920 n=1 Tax=Solanum pennellii TaxID=28526 RepID=A0ABM1V9J8_SOLPN|nr:uncharacterized protein LOC114076920 [Solanum pennellii]
MIIAKELEIQRLKPKYGNKLDGFKAEEYWLNKKGCPIGTVPIPKMTKEQLQSATRHVPSRFGHEYFGYNWIDVHPSLNGDTRTHMYTKWTVDGHQKTGCYNTKCPGFIQLSRVIPIDYAFPRTSEIQTDYKEEVLLRLYQTKYFDYHLTMPVMNEEIGMWPYEVFDKLSANAADLVQFGGKVYTPGGQDVSPAMGNGQFKGGYWQLTCYMRKVLYEIEVDGQKKQVVPDDSKIRSQDSRCYYEGNHYNANDGYWDYNFLFGGKGGKDQWEPCIY